MPSISFRLVMVLPLLALAACGSKSASSGQGAATAEPTAASSDWVEPNPTEPAVPVTLPSTAMTNAPAPAPSGT